MKVLADTSVWIAHFRRSDPQLKELLLADEVYMHSAVMGELACGTLTRRVELLAYLQRMPAAFEADRTDTLFVIEARTLWGKGIGWADAQLIASAFTTGCVLWTHDKALSKVASRLAIAY